jgi:hypothetical protein
VLDRIQAGTADLVERQRIRHVRRGLQAALVGGLHRRQEQLGRQRVVGDLDEVDLPSLQLVERRLKLLP